MRRRKDIQEMLPASIGRSSACQSAARRADAAVVNVSAKDGAPTPAQMNQLIALFNGGRYSELESLARLLAEEYPNSGFVWKILGAALQMQGKNALAAL